MCIRKRGRKSVWIPSEWSRKLRAVPWNSGWWSSLAISMLERLHSGAKNCSHVSFQDSTGSSNVSPCNPNWFRCSATRLTFLPMLNTISPLSQSHLFNVENGHTVYRCWLDMSMQYARDFLTASRKLTVTIRDCSTYCAINLRRIYAGSTLFILSALGVPGHDVILY
jgi:hypothetical protein